MSINEEAHAQTWLKSYLEADSTLMGMVNGVRLRTTEGRLGTPLVKIDRQDADDLMVIGAYRVWSNLTYLVRGIVHQSGGDPDWTDVQVIADRLDTLLHRLQGQTSSTVEVHEVWREEPFTDETVEGGDLYLHAGGIYRLHASAV